MMTDLDPIEVLRQQLESPRSNAEVIAESLAALSSVESLVAAARAVDAEEWSGNEGDPTKIPAFVSAMVALENALFPFITTPEEPKG